MSNGLYSDTEFMQKMTEIVRNNLANENFGVKELAENIGISHSQIHRRLKSIKGQTISQFIRELRLEIAKEMLLENNCTVSEIAYKVGFGSPSYFNKCFHDYYGYSPGEQKRIQLEEENGTQNLKDSLKANIITNAKPRQSKIITWKNIRKLRPMLLI